MNIAKYFTWNPDVDQTWFSVSLFLFSLIWLPLAIGFLLAALTEIYHPGSYPVSRPTLIYFFSPFMYILGGLDRTKILLFLSAFSILVLSLILCIYCIFLLNVCGFLIIFLLILSAYVSILAISKSCHLNPRLVRYRLLAFFLVSLPILLSGP